MSLWEWLFRRRQRQEDLDEEVRSHLRMAAEERLEQGESVEQARVSALREFGNVGLVKEVTRDMWGWRWLENLLQDLRYAARMLRKSPGFTAAAVLTLALSIGANTAIFSALNAVLLRSLPVHNPHELRLINWVGLNPHLNSYTGTGMSEIPGGYEMGTSFPYPAYRDFRDHGTGFADVFAFFPIDTGVTAVAHGEASIAGSLLVSGNFFSGYGVSTLIGRPILPKDDKPGAAPVAVITYRWWERHFGLDPSVVGQTVTLNKTSFTVVGVLSRHYVGPMLGDPSCGSAMPAP